MEKLLTKENIAPKMFRRGDLVEGVVMHKGEDELLLDIGSKAEGFVSGAELEDGLGTFDKSSVGSPVLAMVIQGKSESGMVIMSLKEAREEVKWEDLRRSFREGSKLSAKVTSFNRSGLVVSLAGGVEGFLPFSHLDRAHLPLDDQSKALGGSSERDSVLSSLLGSELPVKIIEFEPQEGRIIASEKEALSDVYRDQRKSLWSALKPDDVRKGVVVGTVPFGLFVRLEDTDVEGLVHISEISWRKVVTPGDHYKIGDAVNVKVLSLDPEKERISLSIKALEENPWEKVKEGYTVGGEVQGVVTKITPFGAFVEVAEGIEGLIHVSETVGPLKVGENVVARIISFEPEKQRLGLSLREVK